MSDCKIVGLYSYPVKSCRGTAADSIRVSPQGVDGDRQLMILKDRKFTNQGRLPKLATVATHRIDASTIEFRHGADQSLIHEIAATGEEIVIDYYGNEVAVIDQGQEVAQFVSSAIGDDVQVAALKESFRRVVPLEEFAAIDGNEQNRFVDVAPVLMTNVASLADLNGRLNTPIPMERFRPNIVVEGLDAFGEDDVTAFEGNDGVRLIRATHCERCVVISTDHLSGERNKEPLTMLKSYRRRDGGYAGGIMFGAYLAVEGTAELRVGDTLTLG